VQTEEKDDPPLPLPQIVQTESATFREKYFSENKCGRSDIITW